MRKVHKLSSVQQELLEALQKYGKLDGSTSSRVDDWNVATIRALAKKGLIKITFWPRTNLIDSIELTKEIMQ